MSLVKSYWIMIEESKYKDFLEQILLNIFNEDYNPIKEQKPWRMGWTQMRRGAHTGQTLCSLSMQWSEDAAAWDP